jgi:flagellar motor switch protein FliN/FliY
MIDPIEIPEPEIELDLGTSPAADLPAGDIPMADRRDTQSGANYKRSIFALPVNVQVVIGTANMTISDLLRLDTDALVELDSHVQDPVDLCVDSRVIARGELVEVEPGTGSLGLKITQIVDISEDLL